MVVVLVEQDLLQLLDLMGLIHNLLLFCLLAVAAVLRLAQSMALLEVLVVVEREPMLVVLVMHHFVLHHKVTLVEMPLVTTLEAVVAQEGQVVMV